MVTNSRSQLVSTDQPYGSASNPIDVSVNNTVGALFLGVVALILLVAFLREEARNRALTAKLQQRG